MKSGEPARGSAVPMVLWFAEPARAPCMSSTAAPVRCSTPAAWLQSARLEPAVARKGETMPVVPTQSIRKLKAKRTIFSIGTMRYRILWRDGQFFHSICGTTIFMANART